jgi:mono/diheme cytochrome c family protein
MKALLIAIGLVSSFAQMNLSRAETPAPVTTTFTRPQRNYLLGCGGCHGENGISNSKLVPDLFDQVGYYLNIPEGREYLVRLPNVAFSVMSDEELTDMLNFMVFRIGGASAPAHTAPYTVAEVGRLRKQPLNEVSLVDYRNHLVETLIGQHGAPQKLRVYGSDRY